MFGIFKRGNSAKYNGTQNTVSFKKSIDILNYTPIEFRNTKRWADYSDPNSFETVHTKRINALKVDEMCGDMYDCEVDGEAGLMKESVCQQLICHLAVIDHHKGIIDGKTAMLTQMIDCLESDRCDIDKRIDELEKLRGGTGNVR